jgi:hypothetical protein
MVAVFVSFVLGKDVFGKIFGIALASAVLIDATVVRMVLVPATMELLGDHNWWLPGWLDRVLPHVHVEAHDALEADIEPCVSVRDRSMPSRPTTPAPTAASRSGAHRCRRGGAPRRAACSSPARRPRAAA